MTVETFGILNDMSTPVLSDLKTVLRIILDIKMFCKCHKFTVRKVSDLKLPSCGTTFQIVLDK